MLLTVVARMVFGGRSDSMARSARSDTPVFFASTAVVHPTSSRSRAISRPLGGPRHVATPKLLRK